MLITREWNAMQMDKTSTEPYEVFILNRVYTLTV